jgi:hypothetical protein
MRVQDFAARISLPGTCVLEFEHLQELIGRHAVMRGNTFENARERSCLDRMMIWDYFVILTVSLSCYANVRACLTSRFLTQYTKRLNELRAVDVAR